MAWAMGKSRLASGRRLARSPPWLANARRAIAAADAPLACHGGARPCGNTVLLAGGNSLSPASVCTTRSFPAVQHGHCWASMPAVRLTNAAADSGASGPLAGMANAARACASLAALQLDAATP